MILIEEKTTGKKGQIYTVVGGTFDSKKKKASTMYFLGKSMLERGYLVDLVCSSNVSWMVVEKIENEDKLKEYRSLEDVPGRIEALITALQTVNGRKTLIIEPYERKDEKMVFDISKRQIVSRDAGSNEIDLSLLNFFWEGFFEIENDFVDLSGFVALDVNDKKDLSKVENFLSKK